MEPIEIAESQAGQAVKQLQERLAFVANQLSSSEWGIIKQEIKQAVLSGVNQKIGEMKSKDDRAGGSQLEKGKPYYSNVDPFPFGKHKGVPFDEVPEGYLRWFMDQSWANQWPGIVRWYNGETEEDLPPLRDDEKVEGASTEIPF
jgi:hypothetical protein